MRDATIIAYGHENIRADHETTFQFTTEDYLTPKGDCIIGVRASTGSKGLPKWLKDHLISAGKIRYEIIVGKNRLEGTAEGHRDLTFEDDVDMVFRTSDYVCGRTVAIRSSIRAVNLPSDMIELLKQGKKIEFRIFEK